MGKCASLVVGLVALMGLSLGCSQANGQAKEYKPGDDVLGMLTFESGGSIIVSQDKALTLGASSGWTWAIFPAEIDLNRNPRMTLKVKTTAKSAVYLELKQKKNADEYELVGKERVNNVWKMKVDLPNTGGALQDVVIDLEKHFRPDFKDRMAKVIAFSDPDGGMTIQSLRFDRKPDADTGGR